MAPGAGILPSPMSIFYSNLIKESRQDRVDQIRSKIGYLVFVQIGKLWKESFFYLSANKLGINWYRIKRNNRTLFEEDIVSDKEFIVLERAFDLRNEIIHEYT